MHVPLPRPLCHSEHSEKTLPRDITAGALALIYSPDAGCKIFLLVPRRNDIEDNATPHVIPSIARKLTT